MQAHFASHDPAAFLVAVTMNLAVLQRTTLEPHERRLFSAHAALTLAALLLALALPTARYRRPWLRNSFMALLRTAGTLALFAYVDGLSVFQAHTAPSSAAASGTAATYSGAAAVLGSYARALIMLLIPVCWLQGMWVTSLGGQLPPAAHLALHVINAAMLMRRARAGRERMAGAGARRATAAAAPTAACCTLHEALPPDPAPPAPAGPRSVQPLCSAVSCH